MFCVTPSMWVIIKKQEWPPHMVTSLSHPNHLLQAVSQGIHCLIATKTTPNTIIASLDTIVWFTPTVPPLRAKHLLASHHRDILSRGASPTGTRFRNQMRRASCLGFCTGFCSYSRHVAVIRLLSTLPSRNTRVCYEVIFTETLHKSTYSRFSNHGTGASIT